MEPKKLTFWSLINDCWIEIPPIQRDYAQGRDNEKAKRIRVDFLMRLHKALSADSPLNLDFVYGSTRKGSDRTTFIPLDGQQRLTTLFLLHWYIAMRDGCAAENSAIFSRFSYQTRPSSSAFCDRLVNQRIDRSRLESKLEKFEDLIHDSSWFHNSWRKDPTVKAMLTMLNHIHALFGDHYEMGWFQRLTLPPNQNPPITFHFLPLDEYRLTDELYVRMNARGKPLTEFENFKARFTDILKNRADILESRGTENMDLESWVHENFSAKMDNKWTDLFWEHVRPLASSSTQSAQPPTVDPYLMNYIVFITEMLYAELVGLKGTANEPGSNKSFDYEMVEQVYSGEKPDNILFLLDSLDFWTEIGKEYGNPSLWMSKLFSGRYEPGKVVLFFDEDQAKQDLWTRCLTGKGFGYYEKILLFALTRRGVYLKGCQNLHQYARFARVVRNLLQTVRGISDQTYTEYRLALSFERLPNQLNRLSGLIEAQDVDSFLISEGSRSREMTGFGKSALGWEADKARLVANHPEWKEQVDRLEDHPNLRGILVHLFEALQDAIKKSPDVVVDIASDFEAIWALERHPEILIVRAFLASGDYFIETWKTSYRRKYFGSPGRWNLVLTWTESNKVGEALKCFLEMYRGGEGSAEKRLLTIIDSYVNSKENGDKDWRYYFIKYPEMVTWKTDWGDATAQNLFAWFNDYETRMLKASNLQGYHINPYVRAVAAGVFRKNSDLRVNPEKYNYASGIYSQDFNFLRFQPKDGVFLKCLQDGWEVTFADGSPYCDRWQVLGLEQESETIYWLCHKNVSEDRVLKAIDFILSLE